MGRYGICCFLIFALLLWSSPEGLSAIDKESWERVGPFSLGSVAPIQLLRSTITPFCAEERPIGFCELQVYDDWLNYVGKHEEGVFDAEDRLLGYDHGTLYLDGEIHRVRFDIQYQVKSWLSLGLELSMMYITGGLLDEVVGTFHRMSGVSQNDRADFSKKRVHFRYVDKDGRIIDYRKKRRGFHFNNIVCSSTIRLPHRECFWVPQALRLQFRIPTFESRDFFGNSGTDIGVSLGWVKDWQRWSCYLNSGMMYYTDRTLLDIQMHQFGDVLFGGVERRFGQQRNQAIIFQVTTVGAPCSFPRLDERTIEIALGYKKRTKTWGLSLAIVENFGATESSPDFGFHMGFSLYGW